MGRTIELWGTKQFGVGAKDDDEARHMFDEMIEQKELGSNRDFRDLGSTPVLMRQSLNDRSWPIPAAQVLE